MLIQFDPHDPRHETLPLYEIMPVKNRLILSKKSKGDLAAAKVSPHWYVVSVEDTSWPSLRWDALRAKALAGVLKHGL